MPKNRVFRDTEVEMIVQVIRTWPKASIEWVEVCAKATPILGFTPSRQGLSQRDAIFEAFQAKKKGLRVTPKEAAPMPSSLAVAANRIAALNAEIAALKAMNVKFMDRFQRWQYNAYKKGMNEKTLDQPMTAIDREIGKAEAEKPGRPK